MKSGSANDRASTNRILLKLSGATETRAGISISAPITFNRVLGMIGTLAWKKENDVMKNVVLFTFALAPGDVRLCLLSGHHETGRFDEARPDEVRKDVQRRC
jgi:hypothetical protein